MIAKVRDTGAPGTLLLLPRAPLAGDDDDRGPLLLDVDDESFPLVDDDDDRGGGLDVFSVVDDDVGRGDAISGIL
jgi:hypothetical protein